MYEREVLQRADGAIDVNFEGGTPKMGQTACQMDSAHALWTQRPRYELRVRVMDLAHVLGLRLPVEDERDWRRDFGRRVHEKTLTI